jgi:hypothetical protein
MFTGKSDPAAEMAVGVEVQTVELELESWIQNYGTIDCGYETMRDSSWKTVEHRFSVRRQGELVESLRSPEPKQVFPGGSHRLPKDLLDRCPVDMLVVEQSFKTQIPTRHEPYSWEEIVEHTNYRPWLVIESWPANAQIWMKGPASKYHDTIWSKMGYVSRFSRVAAPDIGGAINQSRLLVARVRKGWTHLFQWPGVERDKKYRRLMASLLKPAGLVRSKYYLDWTGDPKARESPMPNRPGAFIETERGSCRLLMEETANGLGIPKGWEVPPKQLSTHLFDHTTSVLHWEYVGQSFFLKAHSEAVEPWRGNRLGVRPRPCSRPEETLGKEAQAHPFSWKPLDLTPGGGLVPATNGACSPGRGSSPEPRS